MKFKVTRKGVYWGSKEQVKVGTILDVEGDTVPPALVNKGEVVPEPEPEPEPKPEGGSTEKTVATGKEGDGPKPNEKKG